MCMFQQFSFINEENSNPIKLYNWKSRFLKSVKFYHNFKIACKKLSFIGFDAEYFSFFVSPFCFALHLLTSPQQLKKCSINISIKSVGIP